MNSEALCCSALAVLEGALGASPFCSSGRSLGGSIAFVPFVRLLSPSLERAQWPTLPESKVAFLVAIDREKRSIVAETIVLVSDSVRRDTIGKDALASLHGSLGC